MVKNLGTNDRIARVVVGVILLLVAGYYQSWFGLIGLVLIATAGMGYCGLYQVFGISTCKIDLKNQPTTPTEQTTTTPPTKPQA